MMVVILEIRPS